MTTPSDESFMVVLSVNTERRGDTVQEKEEYLVVEFASARKVAL
jgi:hypothetical protein